MDREELRRRILGNRQPVPEMQMPPEEMTDFEIDPNQSPLAIMKPDPRQIGGAGGNISDDVTSQRRGARGIDDAELTGVPIGLKQSSAPIVDLSRQQNLSQMAQPDSFNMQSIQAPIGNPLRMGMPEPEEETTDIVRRNIQQKFAQPEAMGSASTDDFTQPELQFDMDRSGGARQKRHDIREQLKARIGDKRAVRAANRDAKSEAEVNELAAYFEQLGYDADKAQFRAKLEQQERRRMAGIGIGQSIANFGAGIQGQLADPRQFDAMRARAGEMGDAMDEAQLSLGAEDGGVQRRHEDRMKLAREKMTADKVNNSFRNAKTINDAMEGFRKEIEGNPVVKAYRQRRRQNDILDVSFEQKSPILRDISGLYMWLGGLDDSVVREGEVNNILGALSVRQWIETKVGQLEDGQVLSKELYDSIRGHLKSLYAAADRDYQTTKEHYRRNIDTSPLKRIQGGDALNIDVLFNDLENPPKKRNTSEKKASSPTPAAQPAGKSGGSKQSSSSGGLDSFYL